MDQAFLDYYRCPDSLPYFGLTDEKLNTNSPGYFRFGSDLICYGETSLAGRNSAAEPLIDSLPEVRIEGSTCLLPFDPTQIVNNLRYERYVNGAPPPAWKRVVRDGYYWVRPALPVPLRRHLQKIWLNGWQDRPFPRWPVDCTVDEIFARLMRLALQSSREKRLPFIWFWPEGKSACAIMTHDVETAAGLEFSGSLMDINDSFAIKSSFQIIPEARYTATEDVLSRIRNRGFEINVHDLLHDGHLYDNHEQFLQSAARINEWTCRFGSAGFRAGVLYRNLEWYSAYRFSYDMSVPNVGHLDPQSGGCCTVMPYYVGNILELPVTTIQDYSLFHILGRYSLDLWRDQICRIMQHHGLISFIVHPDYLNTPESRRTYTDLLDYLRRLREETSLWIALPAEVDRWWRQRSQMKLIRQADSWRIEGTGAERARIAYATLRNNELSYSLN
jgi:hypothetical protein